MKTVKLIPHGWACKLSECPPGLFDYKGTIGFKSEYSSRDEVYCAESGEYFVAGQSDPDKRQQLIVQPLIVQQTDNAEN